MHKTMSFRTLRPWLALGSVLLLIAGCPRAPRLPEQADVGGLMTYDYNGVTVMHQYADRDYVHIRLHFGWQLTEENAYAAQNLAVEAAFACGAGEYSPRAWARRLEALGATMAFVPTSDGPVVVLDCLPDRLQQTWELLDLCLTDPQFDKESFGKLRAGRAAGYAALGAEHDQQALQAATAAAWPAATVQPPWQMHADLEGLALTTAQVTFRDLMRQRCNLRLITVGPIDAEKVSDLLIETVEGLPAGTCVAESDLLGQPSLGQCALVHATKGAEAIAGIFPGPSPSSATTVQMRLVMRMLEDRLQARLVARDKVATRVEARYVGSNPGFNLIQIVGNNAFQCAEFALSELRKLRTDGFLEVEVAAAKRALASQILLGYEAAPSLAAQLDATAAAHVPTLAGNEARLLEACDHRSCTALLDQMLTGISWGIVGDTTGVDRKSLQRL
jgi:predicted Zn-dependent peptidase